MSSEWPHVKLVSLADFQEGYVNPSQREPRYFDGPVKWLRATDLNDGLVTNTSRTLSDKGFNSAGKSAVLFKPGSLAISKSGTIGRLGLLGDHMCGNRAVINIKPKPNSVPRYLFFVLRHLRPTIETLAEGSVQKNLYVSVLSNLDVPAPPKELQQAIADILGVLDDRITLLRETNTTLEAIAQALFKSWFVDFDPVHAKMQGRAPEGMDEGTAALFPDSFEESELGAVPKGWRSSTLGKSFDLTMGQSPPGDTYNQSEDGLPFYQGRTDFGFRFPTKRIFCNAPTRLAEIGDALVSVRAPVGDVNMAIERCCIGRGVASVRHQSGCVGYTLYAMKNLGAHFKNFDTEGTIFGSINKKDFEALPVVVPSQGVLVAFDEISKALDGSIEINEQKIRVLVEIRDTLLPRLISGQLQLPEVGQFSESLP